MMQVWPNTGSNRRWRCMPTYRDSLRESAVPQLGWFGVMSKAMRNLVLILLCAALSALTAGCERAPAKSRVVGDYSGILNGASESVALHEDGTFLQQVTLPSHQTLTAIGTWTFKYKAVDLNGYLHFYDEEKNGALTNPERVFLTYGWRADMLIRDWGAGYYTLKHK